MFPDHTHFLNCVRTCFNLPVMFPALLVWRFKGVSIASFLVKQLSTSWLFVSSLGTKLKFSYRNCRLLICILDGHYAFPTSPEPLSSSLL